jgi:hypothetical protein
MTPEQVHEKLGEPERTTMKEAESPEFPTDAYDDLGICVYYGKSGRCQGVDFFEDGSASPTFQGQTLIGRPFGELKSWLQSLKTDVQYYDCGLTFLKFGIDLYSQYYSPQDSGCLVEVAGIFASGYNDEIGIGYPREEAIPCKLVWIVFIIAGLTDMRYECFYLARVLSLSLPDQHWNHYSMAAALESISVVINDNNQPTVMALKKLSIEQEAQRQESAKNWENMLHQISHLEEIVDLQNTEIEKLKNQNSYQTTWLKEHVNVLVIAGFAAILGMTTAAPLALLYTFLPSKLDNAIKKKITFLYNQEVEKLPKAGKPQKRKN